jgi:DNA helicase-2/ATP-dependent DNA helicase PcrA
MSPQETEKRLLDKLTDAQKDAVKSAKRRVLVVAGAGSGKTEVMARRIAWWVGLEGVSKNRIVAFTFTERAAEEMKFRIRAWIQKITPEDQEVSLGGMYVGTIHGFCLTKLREFWPDDYHNFDILDDAGRTALILRGFNGLLGLEGLRKALSAGREFPAGQYDTLEKFTQAYDQLHEHACFDVQLPADVAPYELGATESDWCKRARLLTDVGLDETAKAFAISAARYYAYLRCRRFLDFSTSQSEFVRRLDSDAMQLARLAGAETHLIVDEVQDINPVQHRLIELIVGAHGRLTAVGDHRQSIYGFRGAKVEILGAMRKEFAQAKDAEVVDLQHNFRSTPRLIELANQWADTISPLGGMRASRMRHGNKGRVDHHPSHVALIDFESCQMPN